jgi:hypothetical protein
MWMGVMADRSSPPPSRAPTGPRRFASGTGSPSTGTERIPVVAFIRDPSLLRWIANEFHHLEAALHLTYSHTDMAARLLTELLPTPRLLLVSIDELSMDELISIKSMRLAGWRGRTIALSRARMLPALRTALGIDRLLTPPFVQDLFVDIMREIAFDPPAAAEVWESEAASSDDQAAWEATSRMTTGSSSRYTATPEASIAESTPNPRTISSEVSSSMRTNRR